MIASEEPLEGRALLTIGMGAGWYVRKALILLVISRRRVGFGGCGFCSNGVCSVPSPSKIGCGGVMSPLSVLLDDELPTLLVPMIASSLPSNAFAIGVSPS